MKSLLTLFLLAFSSLAMAQNTGLIVGKVVDADAHNDPLIYANIAIKGTSMEWSSDMTGLYHIENLKDGDYTLVCSFTGYEPKEVTIHVNALEPVEVNFSLNQSSVSLKDLAALGVTATATDKTSVAVNN